MNLKARAAVTGLLMSLTLPALAQDAIPPELAYPGNVALSRNSNGEWEYRKFPSLMPLYYYDLDVQGSGKSACGDTCSGARPPLTVDGDDVKPVGRWTIIQREDGRRQWAYLGRPIYLRFHDIVGAPIGDNEEGTWHLMKP
jgi:predicted lipoprotein with Yx(FWY)xxD motif